MVGRYKRRLASPILAEEKREAAALQRNLQVCDAHSRQLWPVLWEVNYKGPCHCLKYWEEALIGEREPFVMILLAEG